jgi:molybdopterin converting factor subunit 1
MALFPLTLQMSMRVRLLFFGVLKDVAEKTVGTIELPEGATAGDLLSAVEARIPEMQKYLPSVAVAVNQEYAKCETRLRDGDEGALFPPVSGGRR